MVAQQIERRGIQSTSVLNAMRKVPRHRFVPLDQRDHAYDDGPLPIGLGQTISQPYIVAYMTEQLRLESNHRVLEIGTGSGYQTAVLAEIAASVFTVEVVPELLTRSRQILGQLGYGDRVQFRAGDGAEGWPEQQPFDGIIAAAAPAEIPRALPYQLKDGGRMIIPVGSFWQELVLVRRDGDQWHRENLMPVRFVPFIRP
ncbi:MAG: protein-L-isoaspartate(D-aspartate) O-methyltransferase [Acidobacteria bacterium]|nr:protein-L-isoaspartate(D-aspartate) O-methyltransferase [Acidobacteriota bacterium]